LPPSVFFNNKCSLTLPLACQWEREKCKKIQSPDVSDRLHFSQYICCHWKNAEQKAYSVQKIYFSHAQKLIPRATQYDNFWNAAHTASNQKQSAKACALADG
jgi:biotin carboxylase